MLAWLLLGKAMKSSTFFHEVKGVDTDDFTVGEKFAEDAAGSVVVAGLAEGRDEHAAIDDEEVDVSSGQNRKSPSWNLACLRHRHFDELEWFS